MIFKTTDIHETESRAGRFKEIGIHETESRAGRFKEIGIVGIARDLKRGQAIVLPTDTCYGLCASALDKRAVEMVYRLRQREANKPCIILLPTLESLKGFGVKLTPELSKLVTAIWPNRISLVFSCPFKKWHYLHRGQDSLAFRVPADPWLSKLLKKTGPLIAPSANLAGQPPVKTIRQARQIFGQQVSYVEGGRRSSDASILLRLTTTGDLEILRSGSGNSNTYLALRHGEAVSNQQGFYSSFRETIFNPLTTVGKLQVRKQLKTIKRFKPTLIVSSPLLRARETAAIVGKTLRLKVIIEPRLREIEFGRDNGRPIRSGLKAEPTYGRAGRRSGETLRQVKLRMLEAIFTLDKKYTGQRILLVSHGHPLWVLAGAVRGASETEVTHHHDWNFNLAEIRQLEFLIPLEKLPVIDNK